MPPRYRRQVGELDHRSAPVPHGVRVTGLARQVQESLQLDGESSLEAENRNFAIIQAPVGKGSPNRRRIDVEIYNSSIWGTKSGRIDVEFRSIDVNDVITTKHFSLVKCYASKTYKHTCGVLQASRLLLDGHLIQNFAVRPTSTG